MPASAVRPGMVMFTALGDSMWSRASNRLRSTGPVYDLDVERTHNFIANGLVTHNSIYAFRGADIRNIIEFEKDFPGQRVIPLEQNYRSTNTILRAANNIIRNNPERKEKELWSELGEGDPVRILETEDEHAEARFVAAQIARLVEEGENGSRDRGLLPDERAVTRARGRARAAGVAYQVIGGPRFYERAEIKDAIAYLQVLDNPADAVSLQRIANRPRRGIGDTTLARLGAHADGMGVSLFEALDRAEEAGVAGRRCATCRRSGRSCSRSRPRRGADRAELVERVLEDSGYLERARLGADDRGAGPHGEPARARRRRAGVPGRGGGAGLSNFLQEISLYSDQDALREKRVARHADDAPQREGPRVQGRLHDRDGGGDLPALALDRGAGPRGGAAARVRRDDTGAGAADAHARDDALAVRANRAYNLPSRFLDELPGEGVERERLRPASWAAYGATQFRRARTCRSSRPATRCGTGRSARAW